MSAADWTVCEVWRADELAPAPDLHTGDAFLPALDEALERELDRLPTTPAGVELLAGFKIDAEVMHVDSCPGGGFSAVALFDVDNHELSWLWSLEEFDLWLASR